LLPKQHSLWGLRKHTAFYLPRIVLLCVAASKKTHFITDNNVLEARDRIPSSDSSGRASVLVRAASKGSLSSDGLADMDL
jgi:hypothetical protein